MAADDLDRVRAELATRQPRPGAQAKGGGASILRELHVRSRRHNSADTHHVTMAGMVARRRVPHARRRETGRRQVIGHDRPRCAALDG